MEALAQGTSTLTICKRTIPSGGAGFPFIWQNGSSGPQTPFVLNDTDCRAFDVTNMDKFNKFKEDVPPGWSLSNISCTSSAANITGPSSTAPVFESGDDTVAIDLTEPSVTCTFTNEQAICPVRNILTVIDGVNYCCTTENDGPIGSDTASFCCTQACPPGTFETTVNDATFCCEFVHNPTGNNPVDLCCTRKSGEPLATAVAPNLAIYSTKAMKLCEQPAQPRAAPDSCRSR